jgi:hypothetical protein
MGREEWSWKGKTNKGRTETTENGGLVEIYSTYYQFITIFQGQIKI